jgi:hypothetical protein
VSIRWKLRGLALLPTLLLAACGRMHKEPFENVPLAPAVRRSGFASRSAQTSLLSAFVSGPTK